MYWWRINQILIVVVANTEYRFSYHMDLCCFIIKHQNLGKKSDVVREMGPTK